MSDECLSASDSPGASAPATPAEPKPPSNRFNTPAPPAQTASDGPREYGGRKGPDPVRYGDWEKNGRCIDF